MPTPLTPANPPEIFISYSHKDEELLDPPSTTGKLPDVGGQVLAIATADAKQ